MADPTPIPASHSDADDPSKDDDTDHTEQVDAVTQQMEATSLSPETNQSLTSSAIIEPAITEPIVSQNDNHNDSHSDDDDDDGAEEDENADGDNDGATTSDDEWFEADHPLLSRMQIALKKRLTRQLERASLVVLGREEDVSRLKAERESIGVELYHRQQELAAEQMKLESTKTKYDRVRTERMQWEQGLDELRKQHRELQVHRKLQSKKLIESRQELDALNQSLRHIVEYEESMKKEIVSRRRSAYSSEEIMQELEGEKVAQDLVIGQLEAKVNWNRQQMEMYSVQLKVQEEETLSAREILRESLDSMEVIRKEKREYLGKWRSSLIELGKRDEIKENVLRILADVEEQIRLKKMEITQFEKDVVAQQDQIETLQMRRNRMAADGAANDKKLAAHSQLRAEIMEKMEALRQRVVAEEDTLSRRRIEEKKTEQNLRALAKQWAAGTAAIHSVTEQIESAYSESLSLQHGSDSTLSEIKKMTAKMHEKEFVVESLRNEIAKLQLEEVRSLEAMGSLEQRAKECGAALTAKSAIIEEYEKEFKKGLDAVGKKTNVLDRLNGKLEALQRGANGEGDDAMQSPLEHSIHHLAKELRESKEQCSGLQKKWILKQTELVKLVNDTMAQQEAVSNLECKDTILCQKRLRLQRLVKALNTEIKAMHKDINGLRLDITKLNKHINRYNGKHDDLTTECKDIERRYKIDLELGEQTAMEAAAKMEAIKLERAELVDRITESERVILLWERKVVLEAETQKTLDPNYGRKEVDDMKREIHRMEMRLGQLKRKQEDIILEMERSIDKKESIQLRASSTNIESNRRHQRRLQKKQVAALKGQIKTMAAEKKTVTADLSEYTQRHSLILQKLDVAAARLGELNTAKLEMRRAILQKSVLQKAMLNRTASKQKLSKEIDKLLQKPSAEMGKENEDSSATDKLINRQRLKTQKLEALKERVMAVADQHPEYKPLFEIITADTLEVEAPASSAT